MEVRQQVDYLKLFGNNISEFFFTYDRNSRISYMNPRFLDKMGYSEEEIIGHHLIEFISPEYTSGVRQEISDRLERGLQNTFYTGVRYKDGTELIIRVKSYPIIEDDVITGGLCLGEDITEKMKQEEAIKKSEEQLRQITDNIIDIVCKTDTEARIEYWTPSIYKILGYHPAELLGSRLYDNVHPEDMQKVKAVIEECILEHKSSGIELRYRHRDGHYIWMESIGTPLYDEANVFAGAIVISRDISHRKKTEEALQKSESSYRALFNTMQEGFVVWEIIYDDKMNLQDLRFLDINPMFEKNIRISRSKLIGKRISEQNLFIEDYWFRIFNKVLQTGQPHEFEGYLSYLDSYFELFIFQPDPAQIACLVVDISERRRAEKALANEKEWLTVTLESIAEGVITTDVSGRVLSLNQVAADMLGWSQENAIGKQLSDLFNEVENMYVLKENQDESIDMIEGYSVELYDNMVCIVRDGKRRIFSNSAAPIRDKEGNDLGMVMVLSDITEKKKIEEKIHYLSYNDKLTGLYNRAYIDTILSDLDREEQLPVSLIMGDINGLKLTNDVFGHQEGDKLLTNVARILKRSCRDSDIVARWGGDEFLIILPRTGNDVALKVCDRIRKACREAGRDPITLSIALGTASRTNMQEAISEIFLLAEEKMYRNKLNESRLVRSEIIAGLEKTLCERSCEDQEHSLRMKEMAREVAQALKLEKNDMDELVLLAALHDIGNVAVGPEILNKSASLEAEDWEKIKKHPEIGYRMAQSIPELRAIAEAILAHHEHWDGRGYPQGLCAEAIPLNARIISVIDAYDVMTHHRSYKNAISHEQALEELRRCRGSQFDPSITDIFINMIGGTLF